MRRIVYYNASKPAFTGLLDVVPNASFAFDFLKLRTDYTGYCIKVLRDSDNAVMDIGFVGNDLDTATLTAFIGSGTGFVHTAYDQSLNANHAVMTVKANMPRIVNAGVLEVFNGKPALRFMGNQYFELTNDILIAVGGGSTIVSVGNRLTETSHYTTFGTEWTGTNTPTLLRLSGDWLLTIAHGGAKIMRSPTTGTSQEILIAKVDSTSAKLTSNAIDITTVALPDVANTPYIQCVGIYSVNLGVLPTDGYMQNIMHYNYKVDATQENDINTILNGHYGAY